MTAWKFTLIFFIIFLFFSFICPNMAIWRHIYKKLARWLYSPGNRVADRVFGFNLGSKLSEIIEHNPDHLNNFEGNIPLRNMLVVHSDNPLVKDLSKTRSKIAQNSKPITFLASARQVRPTHIVGFNLIWTETWLFQNRPKLDLKVEMVFRLNVLHWLSPFNRVLTWRLFRFCSNFNWR